MANNPQYDTAVKLLALLRARMLAGNYEPIIGYHAAAAAVGVEKPKAYARQMGQVTSMLDYAAFVAGLPMLALRLVKNSSGDVPTQSFTGLFIEFKSEIESVSESHQWTLEDLDRLQMTLYGLPKVGAVALWNNVAERGREFIRWNLHRSTKQAAATN